MGAEAVQLGQRYGRWARRTNCDATNIKKAQAVLRISVKEQSAQRTVLLIEGDLVGDAVGTLAEEAGPLAAGTPGFVLDLAGVRTVDTAGLLLLRQWSGRLTLLRPSRHVSLLLRQYGLEGCVEGS